jgi:DNA-binding CsgD family transcriptional regulator
VGDGSSGPAPASGPAPGPGPRFRAGPARRGVRPGNAVTWRNRFIQLLDHFPLPVAACDTDGTILVANPPLANQWRTMPGRLAGHDILTLFDPLPAEHTNLLRQAVRQRTTTRLQIPVTWNPPPDTTHHEEHKHEHEPKRHGKLTIDLVTDAPTEPLTLLAVLFIHETTTHTETPTAETAPAHHTPTHIQTRILALAASGATTTQIATTTGLSVDGVTYHLERLSRTWNLRGRTALVAHAYATGLLQPGTWPPQPTNP